MAAGVSLEVSLEVAQALQRLESVIVKERTADDTMRRLGATARRTGDAWAKGLREVSAQQRPVLEGNARFEAGLRKIAAANAEATVKARNYSTALSQGVNFQTRLTSGIAQSATEMRTLERAAAPLPQHVEQADRSARNFLGTIGAITAALSGAAAAAGVMRSAVAAAQGEAAGAKGAEEQLFEANRGLAEMAAGATVAERAADAAAMRKRADELAITHGMDRADARELVRQARGLDYEKDLDTIGRATRFAGSATELAGLFKTGKTAFAGEDLEAMQLLNMAAVAAKESGPLELKHIAGGIAEPGAFAPLIGSDSAEMISGLSVFADLFPTPEVASQRMMFLAGTLHQEKSLRGKGMLGGVEALLALPDEEREEIVGSRKELGQTMAFLAREDVRELWRERLAKVRNARQTTGPSGEVMMGIAAAEIDPLQRAAREAKSSAVALEVALEPEAIREMRRAASIDEVLAEDVRAGGNRFKRGFLKTMFEWGRGMTPMDEADSREGEVMRGIGDLWGTPLRRENVLQPGEVPAGPGRQGGLDRVERAAEDPAMDLNNRILLRIEHNLQRMASAGRGAVRAEQGAFQQ